MSAQDLALGMNGALKLNTERGTAVRVRSGTLWPTRHKGPKHQTMDTGDAAQCSGDGAAMISAHQPTLLELYRQDPVAVREEISRLAHCARNESMRAFFARFFG